MLERKESSDQQNYGNGIRWSEYIIRKDNRGADYNEEASTSCFVRSLPLPLTTVGLCSSCKFHCRNKACVCDFDGSLEILPLLPKESRISQDGPIGA